MIKKVLNRIVSPLSNRNAIDEGANSGIRFTVGVTVTILVLSVILILFVVIYSKAIDIQIRESEMRQQENDSISYNCVEYCKNGYVDYLDAIQ